jgi:hypothetical protein
MTQVNAQELIHFKHVRVLYYRIKPGFTEWASNCKDWTQLAQDKVKRLVPVNTVKNLGFHKRQRFSFPALLTLI